MKAATWITASVAFLALFGLCACERETETGPDVCVRSTGELGECPTVDVCCTAGKSDCYLVANARPLPCPQRNCADPTLLATLRTTCGVLADGDGEAAEQDTAMNPPASHTDVQGVIAIPHKPGKNDPLTNCQECHGLLLTGGTGPTCYLCHRNTGHDTIHGGQLHRSGSASSCTICHGPQNEGGLGPACSACH